MFINIAVIPGLDSATAKKHVLLLQLHRDLVDVSPRCIDPADFTTLLTAGGVVTLDFCLRQRIIELVILR